MTSENRYREDLHHSATAWQTPELLSAHGIVNLHELVQAAKDVAQGILDENRESSTFMLVAGALIRGYIAGRLSEEKQ